MRSDSDEVFREVTLRMCGNLDIGSALADTLPYLATLVPVDTIHLLAYDAKLNSVRTVASAETEGMARQLSSPLRVSLSSAFDEFREDVINRADEIPAIRDILRTMGIDRPVSTMSIPLMSSESPSGVVALMAFGHDRYKSAHVELLRALAVPLGIALNNAIQYEELVRLRDRLADDNLTLRKRLNEHEESIVGANAGLRRVMDLVEQVAPMDSPVLLQGETGVGKEVIATALHRLSNRQYHPFLCINCGSIPETLLDSELFGHEKGAFTGASAMRRGVFERADRGTLFLDEIGELPLAAQVKLLRVLQTMQIDRVGGSRPVSVDVRVVAATHRDLSEMVKKGRFRQDLWYRLNVFPIRIPPLRERKNDILLLARHFAEIRAVEMRMQKPTFTTAGLKQLREYDWPGNVRELRNAIERALILNAGRGLTFPDLGTDTKGLETVPQRHSQRPQTFDEAMAEHIRRALKFTHGRIKGPNGAAEILDLPASTLRNKMIRLGIVEDR